MLFLKVKQMKYAKLFLLALCLSLAGANVDNFISSPAKSLAAEITKSDSQSNALVSSTKTAEVAVSIIAESDKIAAGSKTYVGIKFTMSPGWHIYYREPGETGRATSIKLNLPPGFIAEEPIWLKPEINQEAGFTSSVYSHETIIAIPIQAPGNLALGSKLTLSADLTWLACNNSCIPGEASIAVELNVVDAKTAANATQTKEFQQFPALKRKVDNNNSVFNQDFNLAETSDDWITYLQYLSLAFVGGLILNFMPCVLPVVSLKILSFVKEAGESRAKVLMLGLAYAAGTVSTCLVLGGAVIAMQAAGLTVGWGFQFQQPLFVLGMAALLTVMSLGLFGVFMVNINTGRNLEQLSRRKGLVGSFFTGVIATILSTPCTAPFLGAAIGFAFAQPWWGILAVFSAIGSGLASPYVLLSFNPSWQKLLPKPGMWMEHFKQGMGFILLFSAVWLLSILGSVTGTDGLIGGLIFIVATSFSAWLVGTFANFMASQRQKIVVWLIACLISATTLYAFAWKAVTELKAANPVTAAQLSNVIDWQPFIKEQVDQSLSEGHVVFLNFTAEWCQTCKLNEKTTFASKAVVDKFKAAGVVAYKGDWTSSNAEITKILQKFGRSGVPLYVVFSPHRPNQPMVLSEIPSQTEVIAAIEKATQAVTE
jgi:thiol:disulfide interchange protein